MSPCTNCPYYYYEYDDEGNAISDREYCHWTVYWPGDFAPCEEDEYEQYFEDLPEYEEDC